MAETLMVPKRGALYYPYIHIHNENWLKATLLCFRQVRRIVPPHSYTTRDQQIAHTYATLEGPDGPLLDEANIEAQPVHDAQRELKVKIEANLDQITKRYNKTSTPAKYHAGPESFQINRYKLLEDPDDPGLADLLLKNDLAWYSENKADEEPEVWLTMHPRLGAAVMSTLALAIEKNEGLHIVTPSARAHNNLIANREERVFDALLDLAAGSSASDLGKTVDDLTHLVITIGFDLTRLTAHDIRNLIADGADLQQFRTAVTGIAQDIAPEMGPDYRQRELEKQAEKVLAQWQDYQRLLSPSRIESLKEASLEKIPGKLVEKIAEGISGGVLGTVVTHSILGAVPGLLISTVVITGVKAYFRSRKNPMRYLNRIQATTDRSFGSLYIPQWTALAGVD
jgi:hypothetical protein